MEKDLKEGLKIDFYAYSPVVQQLFVAQHSALTHFFKNFTKFIWVTFACWRRLKIDHPYRLKIDQGELLYSVLYSTGIVDQTELVLPPFWY